MLPVLIMGGEEGEHIKGKPFVVEDHKAQAQGASIQINAQRKPSGRLGKFDSEFLAGV